MTEQHTLLVTGATGNVGRQAVSQLLATGAAVRAFVCDPAAALLEVPLDGAEAVREDPSEPETLGEALEGVESVFLVWPFFAAEGASAVVDAIVRHARRVVYLSSEGVRDGAEEQAGLLE